MNINQIIETRSKVIKKMHENPITWPLNMGEVSDAANLRRATEVFWREILREEYKTAPTKEERRASYIRRTGSINSWKAKYL